VGLLTFKNENLYFNIEKQRQISRAAQTHIVINEKALPQKEAGPI
jgi:hypothetical protein